MKIIILRYGEINLKGNNRALFERALHNNLVVKLENIDYKLTKKRNRIFLEVKEEDVDKVRYAIDRTPGVENYSVADITETDFDAINDLALKLFQTDKPVFRVTVKRSYKAFPYNSQELAQKIGASILIANDGLPGMKVKMKDADQEIGIEVHEKETYIYDDKISAMGGLPIGSGGRGLVLLSGGIDSPVAAIETMKRGVKVSCIHFTTPPYTTEKALEKVIDLVEKLKEFDPGIKLYEVPLTKMQLAINENTNNRFALLLMRRMMFRKASAFSRQKKYDMLITGESLGQVASQTIESITLTNMVSEVPVIRPLITYNKNDIIKIARQYDTYEISIIPFEDACTVFAPKKPIIKPKLDETLKEEAKFDYEVLLDELAVEERTKDQLIDEFL